MSMNASNEKQELRARIKEIVLEVKASGDCDRIEASFFETFKCYAEVEIPRDQSVGSFVSMRDEIEMEQVNRYLSSIQETFVPHWIDRAGNFKEMEFVRFKENLNASKTGHPDTLLIPGRAFGEDGSRLGRGKGYYDKYINERKQARRQLTKIGICFEEQIFQNIPMNDHDEKMDVIITPLRVIQCR